MLFNSIDIKYDGDWIIMKGINAAVFISDVARIYKYRFDPDNFNKAKLFFKIVQTGVMIKKLSFTFHRFFTLEIYLIFERLYDITQRSLYKEVMNTLINEPNVAKYFKPDLPIPVSITSRLNDLSLKLFPFQEKFINGYYQAKNKLFLDGYLLSFLAGGGKTLTSIAAAYAFNIIPTIITAPRSTLDGWQSSILRLIPSIKPEEIKLSFNYNSDKDKTKWKFFICNYERIDQALTCSEFAVSPVKGLLVDECHNFRNKGTIRTQSLLNLKHALNLHDIICISATPLKALGSELIPVMELIDPEFNEEASNIFKKIYSRNQYDPITGSVLKNRLQTFIERRTLEDSGIKLPPKERYTMNVKLSNPKPYLLTTVKSNVWKYVKEHMLEYKSNVKPNFEALQLYLRNPVITSNFTNEEISNYIEAVRIKMHDPFNKDVRPIINNFEIEKVKVLDSSLYKEILQIRRKITSYMMILIGKALGQYFVKGKIELLAKMVRENIGEIIKIINASKMKTVIFSTFIEPLISVKEALEEHGIGCILHTGQDNIEDTRGRFKDDNSVKVFLGTTGAVGTGVDQLQFIADTMILLNTPYRSSDLVQIEARLHRQGTPAESVKIYYMKLNTNDEPNILDSESELTEWSRFMIRLAGM